MKHIFVLCSAASCLLVSCSQSDNRFIPQPRTVNMFHVKQRQVARPVYTSGRLSSFAQMKLSFKVGGIIDSVFVSEGEDVVKGQILAKLHMDEIEAQHTLAQISFEKAQRDLVRVKSLYADSASTLEQLQNAQTALSAASAKLSIAEFNRNHAVISAPSKGRILTQAAESSEVVGAGYPVFLFGSSENSWRVSVGLTDRDMVRIAIGDSARIEIDAYPGKSFLGFVKEIGGAPDPKNGTFEIKIALSPGEYRFVTGFICRTVIYPSSTSRMAYIPFNSLVDTDDESAWVFTVNTRQKAVKIPVSIAYLIDDSAAISSGLEGIDTIISDGSSYISEGDSIVFRKIETCGGSR